MESNNRAKKISLGSFNLIKGIAICVIIMGHISSEFDISQLTWFHPMFALLEYLKTPFIPLFFIISGYGFKANTSGRVFKKTVKMLIVPYVFVMVAFGVLQPLSAYVNTGDWSYSVNAGISFVLAFLLGIPIPGKVLFGYKLANCSIVWFILALFWAHNILNLILKIKSKIVQVILVVGCAMLGYILCVQEIVYFCIPQGLIATSYLYIGYELKRTKLLERGLPYKWMYIIWVIVALLYARWGQVDLCYGKFAFFPVDYIGVGFLALLLLALGVYAENIEWKVLDIIKNVGFYSYWVICVHSVEQKCLPWKKFVMLTSENRNIGFILALIIKAIIITTCCILFKKLEKWKYGKKKRIYRQQ